MDRRLQQVALPFTHAKLHTSLQILQSSFTNVTVNTDSVFEKEGDYKAKMTPGISP